MATRPKSDRCKVELEPGGSIELVVTASVFDLSSTDRDFVFEMIDRFNNWRQLREDDHSQDEVGDAN